ncbi:MAG: AIR carboxylase family protein [Armatimonadetes bacterium]|nr:AIR carboxylase family protein [Armatimonadota bacterium]
MSRPLVPILIGSPTDGERAQAVARHLERLAIPSEIRVASAHKTPEHLLEILRNYENDPRPKVYVTIAGRSNALSGFVDGQVRHPVVACPPPSASYGGADLFSSLRMPSGVAPAVVLEPEGAALLCAKILALGDEQVRTALERAQQEARQRVLDADAAIRKVSV